MEKKTKSEPASLLQDVNARKSKYQRLADELKGEIEAGAYESQLPTIAEVAQARGVALATAQKAYQDLKDSGWITSQRGRGSFVSQRKRKKSYLIGALTHGNGPLSLSAVRGMREVLRARPEELLFRYYDVTKEKSLEVLQNMLEGRELDGVIVLPADAVEARSLKEYLQGLEMPHSFISYAPIYGMPELAVVTPDESRAIVAAFEHLVAQGRKRIAFVHSRSVVSGQLQPGQHTAIRYQQYRAFMLATGLESAEPLQILDQAFDSPEQVAAILDYLREADAVFCDTQGAAHRVMRACLMEGIAIPRDLALVAMNDDVMLARLGVSAVSLDFEGVGRKAMELLLESISREQPCAGTYEVPAQLILRSST